MPIRTVPPEPRVLPALRAAVRADLERAGLDGSVIDDAVFCMHEACLNAMQHGKGTLHVGWEVHDGEVHFEVGEQGPGFELALADQPPAPERQSGRGLFLIGRLANWLETGVRGSMHYVAFAIGRRTTHPAGRLGAGPLTGRLSAAASPGSP